MCSAIKLTFKVKGVVSKTRESALNRVFPNTLKMITGKQPLFFSNVAFLTGKEGKTEKALLVRRENKSKARATGKSLKSTRIQKKGFTYQVAIIVPKNLLRGSRIWAWCVKRKYKHARLVEGALLLALLLLSFALSGFPCSCFLLLRRVEGFLTFCSALFLPFI